MAEGRRVEEQPIVLFPVVGDLGEAVEQRGLLGARRHPGDVDLTLHFGGEAGRRYLRDALLDLFDIAIGLEGGVDLHRPEAGLHFSPLGTERHLQHIGGGMGGIGRNE